MKLCPNKKKTGTNTQNGIALIVLVFILALTATAYVLYATTSKEHTAERELITAKALAEAKQSLLGWSVLQNNPGQLPCPEDTTLIGLSTEGQSQSSCNSPNPVIGRLPWRTLGLGDIRDGNGDKLWYVISTGFRNAPINSNTPAQLTLDGVPNSAVAIIFSVGIPLAGQLRPAQTSAPAGAAQYLDGSNNDGDINFVSVGAAGAFNDRLMPIKQAELFSLVTNRILGEIRGDSSQGLVKFYPAHANTYPFADGDGDGDADSATLSGTPSYQGGTNDLFFSSAIKTTLVNNGWFPLITYTVTGTQQAVTLTLNGKMLAIP